MATTTRSEGDAEPTFSEVLGKNGPYIAATYLLNLVLLTALIDFGALLNGRVAYNALVPAGAGGDPLSKTIAAGFAGLFVVITLVGVLFAVSIANEGRRDGLDEYELEERISTVSIVPAIQLLAVILTPVLTRHSIVAGMDYLLSGIAALL